jgi:hypothetical protein
VSVDHIVELSAQPSESPLQRMVGERLHLPARNADHVVMMVAAGKDRLVSRGIAEVQSLDEAEPDEVLERTVNAGKPDGAALGPKAIEDLGRAQAAVLPSQEFDHGASRSAAPESTLAKRGIRARGPLLERAPALGLGAWYFHRLLA